MVRRDLQDPLGKWWSDAELDLYITEWQDLLQSQFELRWSTTTSTTSAGSATNPTDCLRRDAIYCVNTLSSTYLLVPTTPSDIERQKQVWGTDTAEFPRAVYSQNYGTASFYPGTLTRTSTYIWEYPKLLSFASSTATCELPAWTQFSVVPYCAYRAYSRFGPNQSVQKALRRKKRFERKINLFRYTIDRYLPERSERLRPGRRFAANLSNPRSQSL